MTSVSPSREPPLRRRTRGKALLVFGLVIVALSAFAAPQEGAAYSCSVGEGRAPQNRIEDCRKPVKPPEHRRPTAQDTGRIGATPLVLLLLAVGGTLLVPIGFDRVKRPSEELHSDRLLR